ncbi:MAG TPA: DUF1501 domain-containing protein [Candidatus Limnocylindria bacterium]|jgi:hypothetical protein|nr:DUF1501 domain-containing protein [Candidatus Limnocylindria bacterium]
MGAPLSNAGRWLLNRRDFLQLGGTGLGAVALAALLGEQKALGAEPIRPQWSPERPLAPRAPPLLPRAHNILVIFCSGALSQLESWDYKPELFRRHGQPLPGGDKLITFQGENGALTRPLWDFKPRGKSGKMLSEMLPNLASLADDLCFIHSMTAKSNTHGPAENQMSTGFTLDGFPSMGAWVSYALGTENQNLPAFVAIPDPRGVPQMGPNHWNSAFLPAVFQGVAFNADRPIPNLATPAGITAGTERNTRDFLRFLNDRHLAEHPGDADLSARIASYELAARMQLSAAEVGDFSKESRATLDLYGIDDSTSLKSRFARNCLLARRLVERGVRFVQLFNGSYAMGEGVGNWDGHKTLKEQYSVHAPILDQGAAALITDLRMRGLLANTVVAFVTEFGRMPTFQKGAQGRDHNPHGFTVWLTGAGVKRGYSYGATDEFGHQAVQDISTIYDLHATLLHLLGLDHQRLSFYHGGIERRLTDVHGDVIKGILA